MLGAVGDTPVDKSITDDSVEFDIVELLGVTDEVDEEVDATLGGKIEPESVPFGCSPCAVK